VPAPPSAEATMIVSSERNVLYDGGEDGCALRRRVKWEVHAP
jgi:hypothetical protein